MQVRTVGTNIGARIDGIDFSAGLDDVTIDAVADALFTHQVVSIDAAEMTPDQHLQLARRFGALEKNRSSRGCSTAWKRCTTTAASGRS